MLPQRIKAKIEIDPETGCWIWQGAIQNGYGITYWKDEDGKNRTGVVHRFVFKALGHQIPEGLWLDHLCRNRACCNPAHLEAVTHRENTMRGKSFIVSKAQQTHCIHGHEFTPENTVIDAGRRKCLECRRRRTRESYQRRTARNSASPI